MDQTQTEDVLKRLDFEIENVKEIVLELKSLRWDKTRLLEKNLMLSQQNADLQKRVDELEGEMLTIKAYQK